jgi:replicative DNA helicase
MFAAWDYGHSEMSGMTEEQIMAIMIEIGIPGFSSGGALRRGDLSTLGGGTGGGKSTVSLQAAIYNALREKRVLYFSLEMTLQLLAERVLKMTTEGQIWNNRGGITYTADMYTAAREVAAKLQDLPITWVDEPIVTVEDVVRMVPGYDLVIVDYFQLLSRGKGESEYELQLRGSAQLKAAAKEHNSHIMCLVQFNKAGYKLAKESPELSHIATSGGTPLVQTAATAMTVALEPFEEGAMARKGKITVSKSRHTRPFTIPIIQGKGMSFALDGAPQEEKETPF